MTVQFLICIGVDSPTQYSCEANNAKGVTVSREAHVNIKGKTAGTELFLHLSGTPTPT